jgi:voltage-gated potassium channel
VVLKRERDRFTRSVLEDSLTIRRAVWAIAIVTVATTVAGGILMWLVDREEFPNVWLGLWWAVQTVTTVGYGDAVPSKDLGRIIAAVVMLTGIGFLSVVTASVTAAFVGTARHRFEMEETGAHAERLAEIDARLERIERALSDRQT